MSNQDKIFVYITSTSGSMKIKKAQQKIELILTSKKIEYELLDVAADGTLKEDMRAKCGDANALPPQIFKGDQYLGNFEAFDDAVEAEQLEVFLRSEGK